MALYIDQEMVVLEIRCFCYYYLDERKNALYMKWMKKEMYYIIDGKMKNEMK